MKALSDRIAEVDAVEPLHRQEALAVRGLAVGDVRDDVRVAQLREDAGLAGEAFGLVGAADAVMQQLEGHQLAAVAVTRAKHGAHAAAAGDALDLESIGDHGAGRERAHRGVAVVRRARAVERGQLLGGWATVRQAGDFRTAPGARANADAPGA